MCQALAENISRNGLFQEEEIHYRFGLLPHSLAMAARDLSDITFVTRRRSYDQMQGQK
jgi:hypothetical protein